MAVAGAKPKPTKLKVVQGNPGKRPLNKDEPEPDVQIPICPEHIQGEGRKEWNRICLELKKLGLITEIDRAAISVYCQAWDRWVEAEDMVRKHGTIVKVGDNNHPMQSPYLSVANTAMKTMMSTLVEFGMTPSSRTRVKAATGKTDDEKKAEKYGL